MSSKSIVATMAFEFADPAIPWPVRGSRTYAGGTPRMEAADRSGTVFARCTDAMVAAEEMMAADRMWLQTIIEAAERRGGILLDRVYPSQ